MSFPISLKGWREDRGLKVIQAAKLAGVSQSAWSQWEDETNTSQRKRATCIKIAKALNMPLDVVLSAAGFAGVNPDMDLAQEIAIMEEGIPVSMRPKFRRVAISTLGSLASELAGA